MGRHGQMRRHKSKSEIFTFEVCGVINGAHLGLMEKLGVVVGTLPTLALMGHTLDRWGPKPENQDPSRPRTNGVDQ